MNNAKIVRERKVEQYAAPADELDLSEVDMGKTEKLLKSLDRLLNDRDWLSVSALFFREQAKEELGFLRKNYADPVRAAWHAGRLDLLEGIADLKALRDLCLKIVADAKKRKGNKNPKK